MRNISEKVSFLNERNYLQTTIHKDQTQANLSGESKANLHEFPMAFKKGFDKQSLRQQTNDF